MQLHIFVALIAGAIVGWIAYRKIAASRDQGLLRSLFIGAVGGGLATGAATALTGSHADSPLAVSVLVTAMFGAVVLLIVSNFVARHLDT